MNRIKGDIGRNGANSPLRPFVMLEIEDDWLAPARARRMAQRLLKAADQAEAKYREYRKSQVKHPTPAELEACLDGWPKGDLDWSES
jgi:hypothetical protein